MENKDFKDLKTIGIFPEYLYKDKDDVNGYDCFVYIRYYYEKIQINEDFIIKEEDGFGNSNTKKRIGKGESAGMFYLKFMHACNSAPDVWVKEYVKISQDEKLIKIQANLLEKGMQICMLNIYFLAQYILYKCKTYKFMKLKPQIQDTLSEINDVSEIIFVNRDGTKSTSNNHHLIKTVIEALKNDKPSESYEAIPELISIDKLSNKEILQIYFVHDMTEFFKSKFNFNKRKNSIISSKEQELILYLMTLLEIAPEGVTNSRYRQLLSKYIKINQGIPLCDMTNVLNQNMNCSFIKYKLWKTGKIDFTDSNIDELFLYEKTMIKFTS